MDSTAGLGPDLEIREPVGALERIEAHLRAHGFFAPGAVRDGRVADIYLGHALADPMRRGSAAPKEPLELPVAACRIRPHAQGARSGAESYRVGTWEPTWTRADHRRAVERAREAIADGEVYQVNVVQHLSAPFEGDPAGVATSLAHLRPIVGRPMEGHGWSIVSASPELFLARQGRRLWTMPIKGTRPLGDTADLRSSAKDAAEHMMIVDLERNDLGRVCEPGSIAWPELMAARTLAGVEHLVSRVEGTLRPDAGWAEIISATFPGGSVTGAPKIAALDHISRLEPVGRGASMGALGRVWPDGDLELALTIRTFAVGAGRIHLWVGGGIVWDSDPDAEVEEAWVKARPLLKALAGGGPAPQVGPLQVVAA